MVSERWSALSEAVRYVVTDEMVGEKRWGEAMGVLARRMSDLGVVFDSSGQSLR